MLTLTPTAADAVRELVADSPIEGNGGVRISAAAPTPEGTPLQVAMADEPAATDETVDERGAKVFVAAEAAPFLDGKCWTPTWIPAARASQSPMRAPRTVPPRVEPPALGVDHATDPHDRAAPP